MAWKNSGVIIWSETADRVMCLLLHQALDVLDDIRELSGWKDAPFCLEWDSYSMPFSEKNRIEWRTTKNHRSSTLKNNTGYGGIVLTPEQTQDLFLFLERHQAEIHEFADAKTKDVRKILGRAYTMILGWGVETTRKFRVNIWVKIFYSELYIFFPLTMANPLCNRYISFIITSDIYFKSQEFILTNFFLRLCSSGFF